MSYPKIYEVLPKDIILQIQDYIEGEVIYIPKRSENKKSWGDCTDTKASHRFWYAPLCCNRRSYPAEQQLPDERQ